MTTKKQYRVKGYVQPFTSLAKARAFKKKKGLPRSTKIFKKTRYFDD